MKLKPTKKSSLRDIFSLVVLAGFVFVATLLLKSDKKGELISKLKLGSQFTVSSTFADTGGGSGGGSAECGSGCEGG